MTEPATAVDPGVPTDLPPMQMPDLRLPELIEPDNRASEGPVGTAALIYTACQECDTAIVREDGTQLVLPSGPVANALGYGLSPDGRWLVAPELNGLSLRDLEGDQTVLVELPEAADFLVPWAWSIDARWLLLAAGNVDTVQAFQSTVLVFDIVDQTATSVMAPAGRHFAAVMPSGRLLALDGRLGMEGSAESGPLTSIDVEVVDPTAPELTDGFTIDGGDWLRAGETFRVIAGSGIQLTPRVCLLDL